MKKLITILSITVCSLTTITKATDFYFMGGSGNGVDVTEKIKLDKQEGLSVEFNLTNKELLLEFILQTFLRATRNQLSNLL